MNFEFEGRQYRLRFQYDNRTVTREIAVKAAIYINVPGDIVQIKYRHIPGRQIVLMVTEAKRRVVCQLLEFNTIEISRFKWRVVAQGLSRCSLEDQYIRKAGQGKALKKLLIELDAADQSELADSVRQVWWDRFTKTPAKTSMASTSGSAAQSAMATERIEAPKEGA